jgi:hypothetical protein
MTCPSCASGRVAEFSSEMMINFMGLKHIEKPGVLLFPKAVVCLDCGFLRCNVPARELDYLREDRAKLNYRPAHG